MLIASRISKAISFVVGVDKAARLTTILFSFPGPSPADPLRFPVTLAPAEGWVGTTDPLKANPFDTPSDAVRAKYKSL